MTILQKSPSVVQSKLNSCRRQNDAWRENHEQAKLLYSLEDLLGDMVECFELLKRTDAEYRSFVRKSPESYDARFDNRLKQIWRNCLDLAEDISKNTIPSFDGYSIANLDRFEKSLAAARVSAAHDFDEEAFLDWSAIGIDGSNLTSSNSVAISQWPE